MNDELFFVIPKGMGWYFRLVLPSEAHVQKAQNRAIYKKNAYLLAVIALILSGVLVILIPATIGIPNSHTFQLCSGLLAVCLVCLVWNRLGMVKLACGMLVVLMEITLVLIISTTRPLEMINLPLFDIFAIVDLLAISLLPGRVVALYIAGNVLFTILAIFSFPHTGEMQIFMQNSKSFYLYNMISRPICIQVVPTAIAWLWLQTAMRIQERAKQVEIQAQLEQARAQDAQAVEMDIKHLLIWVLEQQVDNLAYEPQSQNSRMLVNAFTLLKTRLLQTQTEEQAYRGLVQAIQQSSHEVSQREAVHPTETLLDRLLLALARMPKTYNPWPLWQRFATTEKE